VRLPLVLDDALAFAARHPVGHLDDPTRRRLLTLLTSAPAGTIVLGDERGVLRFVATVVDVIADQAAAAELVVLGAAPGLPGAVFAGEALAPARAFARAVGRRKLHVALPRFVDDVDEVLARAGFGLDHEVCAMRRPRAGVDALEPDLPHGWRWAPLDDALVAPAHAVLAEMFRGAPSATLPPLEAFRRGAFASAPGWQVLLDGETVAGLVRLSVSGASGEIRILGRRPSDRGRGLGRLLLDHGLRLLASAGAGAVSLEVAATNERALDLYRAFDFEVVDRTPVFAALL
jgi:ribosomal protein S18 acetylase RimI-like enzyme